LKNPYKKRAGRVVNSGEGPEFKPQYHKNKKKEEEEEAGRNGAKEGRVLRTAWQSVS
jgi:hypothetical protein